MTWFERYTVTRSTDESDPVVTVLAGGWSARNVDKDHLPGHVIGVNDSAVYAPAACHSIISMDRKWTEGRWEYLNIIKKPAWIRVQALKRIRYRPEWMTVFECDHQTDRLADGGMDQLNGMHSAACGLNLAFLMVRGRLRGTLGRGVIYLVGFDHRPGPRGEMHWYDQYPWGTGKIDKGWASQYADAHARCLSSGIDVFNVGDWSAIQVLPRISYEELARHASAHG